MSTIPQNGCLGVCVTCGFQIKGWVKYDHIGGDEYIVNDWGWDHLSFPEPAPIPHTAIHDESKNITYVFESQSIGLYKAAEERFRQQFIKGYGPVHDAEHSEGELARAGACYAEWSAATLEGTVDENEPSHPFWPWSDSEWKPVDPKRALEKAMALLAAEYDKLVRDEANQSKSDG